jgi:hypothetical protein
MESGLNSLIVPADVVVLVVLVVVVAESGADCAVSVVPLNPAAVEWPAWT